MTEVFRAKEAFTFTSRSGVPRIIRPGDLVTDDDPDFRGREHLFEPAVSAANRAAETASAAPGERRSRPRLRPEPTNEKLSQSAQSQEPHSEPSAGEKF